VFMDDHSLFTGNHSFFCGYNLPHYIFIYFLPLSWKANWIQSSQLVGLALLILVEILIYPSQIFIFIQNASEVLLIPLHVY